MTQKNNRNNKQDINIAELSIEFKNLKEKVNTFINNEFKHFRDRIEKRVDWILWILIIGFLITITIRLL